MSTSHSQPVAVITGAASGIGLALTKHLLAKSWRVYMADVNSTTGDEIASSLGPNAKFLRTDVASWDDQAVLFKSAFNTWGRIDFFAANAGIDDKDSLYVESEEERNGEPIKPNLVTIEVDLIGVIYGLKLAVHYMRRSESSIGSIVSTSSAAGLYPMNSNPQYTTAKHGLVGLTRAVGPKFAKENIRVNCILPAFVPTGLAPAGLVDQWPAEHLTPMSTILKAYDTFIEGKLVGETVECSTDQLYFRTKPDYPNESQRWVGEESMAYFFNKAYAMEL